jgi:hypothetical protein
MSGSTAAISLDARLLAQVTATRTELAALGQLWRRITAAAHTRQTTIAGLDRESVATGARADIDRARAAGTAG